MSVFATLCKKSGKIFDLLKLTCYLCDVIREIEQLTPLIEHFKIILTEVSHPLKGGFRM